MDSSPQKNFFFVIAACVGSVILGSSAVFVRISDMGPLATGFYRMLFSLPFFALWVLGEKVHVHVRGLPPEALPSPREFALLVLGGALFSLDLALFNWGIDHTTILNSTLFNNAAAFFVPLFLWLCFKVKPSMRTMLCVTIGLLGCALLGGESLSLSADNFLGDIVSLGSGMAVALYVITIKEVRDRCSTSVVMLITGLASTIALGVMVVFSQESFGPLTSQDWISIWGQALLVHTVGQALLAFSMAKVHAAYVGIIMLLAPVTSALLGWLIYDEVLTVITLGGIILVMASIVTARTD